MKCQRCGLPTIEGPASCAGPQCKCWAFFTPAPNAAAAGPIVDGCRPFVPLTEADVRRIVREELARTTPAAQGDAL